MEHKHRLELNETPTMAHICDDGYKNEALPEVVPVDFGIGVTFKNDEGIKYTTVARDGQREIRLKISDLLFSIGAMHYYGKLEAYEPSLKWMEDGKECSGSIGGYFDRHKPEAVKLSDIDIKIKRPLTQKEIDEDAERWKGWDAGSMINNFNTPEEIREQAKKIVAVRFPGWKFVDDENY